MIHLRNSFLPDLDNMPKLEGDFSPEVSLNPSDEATTLAAIPQGVLQRLMADATTGVEGTDAKLCAAYLMGDVSAAICEVMTGLALRSHYLVAARASAVALAPRFVSCGENGASLAFNLHLDLNNLAFVPSFSPYGFAKAIEEIMTPLATALSSESGLSVAALFRVVGDSLAHEFLAQGRVLGTEVEAIDLANAALREPGTKLCNKQVRFDFITLPEDPDIGEWLRVRGGCCRAYTRPEKPEYCTTCVLRDDKSRNERYRDYLRRTRLGKSS